MLSYLASGTLAVVCVAVPLLGRLAGIQDSIHQGDGLTAVVGEADLLVLIAATAGRLSAETTPVPLRECSPPYLAFELQVVVRPRTRSASNKLLVRCIRRGWSWHQTFVRPPTFVA